MGGARRRVLQMHARGVDIGISCGTVAGKAFAGPYMQGLSGVHSCAKPVEDQPKPRQLDCIT